MDEGGGTASQAGGAATPEEKTSTSVAGQTGDSEAAIPPREKWGNKHSFILVCIGYAVGLGNVWRFPKLAYENGGLAFLIPYWFAAMLFGLPGLYFEYVIGQYTQSSAPQAYRKMAPFFQGLGWTMCLIAIGISIYYNVLIAWTTLYIVNAFEVPLVGTYLWSLCDNPWNTPTCVSVFSNRECKHKDPAFPYYWNGTCHPDDELFLETVGITRNMTTTATEEYFRHYILKSTASIDDMGEFNYRIFGALIFVWIVTCLTIMFGAKAMGYTAYFTATVPYMIIGAIFLRGITLEGAWTGIKYYIASPDFSKLLTFKTWALAVSQCCYSLALGIAGLLSMASYNERTNNCFRDALIVVFADSFMSVFGGIGVFAIVGFMAHVSGREVENVISEGAALAFVVYPEATALMPAGWIFALAFFFMLFLLGIGTQFGLVAVLSGGLSESFPTMCNGRPKLLFTPLVCLACFCAGLIMCTGSGVYWLTVIDMFAGNVGIPIVCAIAFIVVSYIYGIKNFLADITELFGTPRNNFSRYFIGTQSYYFIICWMGITPMIGFVRYLFECIVPLLQCVFVYQVVVLADKMMHDTETPAWATGIGALLLVFQFTPLIMFAVRNVLRCKANDVPLKELFAVQPDHPAYARINAANANSVSGAAPESMTESGAATGATAGGGTTGGTKPESI